MIVFGPRANKRNHGAHCMASSIAIEQGFGGEAAPLLAQWGKTEKVTRRAFWLLLGMSLGVGLSAFQSLPFLEYLQRSEAARARDAYNVFYVPLYHLITLVLPDFFGNIVHGNYWGYSNNIGPAMYVGVLPLLLVDLPPGNHEIIFSYQPDSFIWGLRISWLAAFAIVASAVAMRKLNVRTNNVPAGRMAHDYESTTHP